MGELQNLPIQSIDGKYDFEIEGLGAGVGELRLTEFLQTMLDLAKQFAELAVRTDGTRQLEVAIAAVGASRDFLRYVVPGTDIEAPLAHLMTALIATAEGHKAPLFAIAKVKHGRDFARVMVEVKASASVDILHDAPLRMSLTEAAGYVAKVLESSGVDFFSKKDVPPYRQVLEWRKRLRKAKGAAEHQDYFASIRAGREGMKRPAFDDPKSAVARALEWLVAGVVSPAHLNRDTSAIE
jgi:hypothetical protein